MVKNRVKIVTVDDSPIIAERLKEMLGELEGIEYSGNASSIASALDLVRLQRPHVVILDIHLESDMPKANGINLLMDLRRKYADLKIVMLTNLAEDQYRNTCLFLGANHFLDKSHEFDKVVGIIKEFNSAPNDEI